MITLIQLGNYMSEISTEYLSRFLEKLKKSYEMIKSAPKGSIDYEMYRNSLVKGFELITRPYSCIALS